MPLGSGEALPRVHSLVLLGRHRERLLARVCVLLAHRGIELVSLRVGGEPGQDVAPIRLGLRLPAKASIDAEINKLNRFVDVVGVVRGYPASDGSVPVNRVAASRSGGTVP
jgi:acetolactate synthase small subunit